MHTPLFLSNQGSMEIVTGPPSPSTSANCSEIGACACGLRDCACAVADVGKYAAGIVMLEIVVGM